MRHPKANAAAQQCLRKRIERYERDGRPIVYIDESGFAHDMPRTHGYALKGQRCFGSHDWNAKGRGNVHRCAPDRGSGERRIDGCNVDAEIFNLWLKGDLLPKLPSKSILVMDRATFHRRADTKAVIAAAGHTLEYLPACGPDLNDIEHKWAEAKAYRRKTGRSVDQIFTHQNWNQN